MASPRDCPAASDAEVIATSFDDAHAFAVHRRARWNGLRAFVARLTGQRQRVHRHAIAAAEAFAGWRERGMLGPHFRRWHLVHGPAVLVALSRLAGVRMFLFVLRRDACGPSRAFGSRRRRDA